MKKTIYCPDITCESCVKVLTKQFQNRKGVQSFFIGNSAIDVDYNPEIIKEEDLLKLIHEKGYRASFSVFGRASFSERAKDFMTNKEKYALEYKMLTYAAASFLLLFAPQFLIWHIFFNHDPATLTKYIWWVFYLNLSVVTIGAAIWHYHAYKAQITHMIGMMVGMTIGMVSGLLVGTLVGATNGMFMGTLVGLLFGVTIGALNGKCCGIMGIMEGMMAGVMGGTMGPMISLMMKYDYLLLFMPLFMLVNMIILWGLSYMLYEEVIEENPNVERKPLDFFTFFSFCFLATIILLAIMIFGYKSPLGIA
ncbi:heavy metal translocating P-type ATPase [Candidatus Woesearchaeota archaeon]|nr:heavy metal translocating P-type ATPase [Candidatus Woesearchaeota archaeon]